MKKILIALSLILSLTMVSAQPKNAADAQKAVAKAEAAAADAKKATKPATWIAVAKAYIEAYEQPSKNILTGTPQSEVKIFLKDQKVLSTSQKQCTEGNYTVESYADKDLYYNEAGILDFYLVTKPALEGDMLAKAIDALEKAKAVDPKDSKAKDITAMMEDIHGKYANEALSEYLAGDFAKPPSAPPTRSSAKRTPRTPTTAPSYRTWPATRNRPSSITRSASTWVSIRTAIPTPTSPTSTVHWVTTTTARPCWKKVS